jgi:hypothetical protein
MKKLILFIFLITSTLLADNFYISSSGNDSNNGTSASTPWKTLAKVTQSLANGTISPGDSILFKRNDSWSPSSLNGDDLALITIPKEWWGSESAVTVFGAYGSGNKPKLSNENITDWNTIWRIQTSSYITWQDLEFYFPYRGCFTFRCSDGTVMDTVWLPDGSFVENETRGVNNMRMLRIHFQGGGFYGGRAIGIYNPFLAQKPPTPNSNPPVYKFEVGYCTFDDTGGEDCVSLITFVNVVSGKNIWFHHNVMTRIREEALDISGGNNHYIEYNKFIGMTVNGIKLHSQYNHVSDCVIRGNLILMAGLDIEYDMMSGSSWTPGHAGMGMVLENVSGFKVYNNTSISRYSGYLGDRDRDSYNDKGDYLGYWGQFENNYIHNNIFMGIMLIVGNFNNMVDSIGFKNTFSHNSWYSLPYSSNNVMRVGGVYTTFAQFQEKWVDKYGLTGETIVEPEFTDFKIIPKDPPNTWSFYDPGTYTALDRNSPQVDAGTTVPSPGFSEDLGGTAAPQGVTYDQGAYEFGSGGPVRPRLNFTVNGFINELEEPLNIGSFSVDQTGYADLYMSNPSPDSTVIIDTLYMSGEHDSLFTASYWKYSGGVFSEITSYPYTIPASGYIYANISFDGSTVLGTKNITLYIDHNSSVMTEDPFEVTTKATVTSNTPILTISGDSTYSFTTELGNELLGGSSGNDWQFNTFSAGLPVGWTNNGTQSAPTTGLFQVSGGVQILTPSTWVAAKKTSIPITTTRSVYEVDITQRVSGDLKYNDGSNSVYFDEGAKTYTGWLKRTSTDVSLSRAEPEATNVSVNYFSLKPLTSSWDATMTLTNSGQGTITCDSITVSNASFTSGSLGANPFSIDAGQSWDFNYEFIPNDTGYVTGTFKFWGLSTGGNYEVSVAGNFLGTVSGDPTLTLLAVAQNGIYWSTQDTGTVKDTTVALFYNSGTDDLTVTFGDEGDQFSVVYPATPDTVIPAGDTCYATIRYDVADIGFMTSSINIAHDDTKQATPVYIVVGGTGGVGTIDPAISLSVIDTLNFGSINVGQFATGEIIITNNGGSSLTYSISSSPASPFNLYYNSGSPTAALATDTLQISVTPTVVGYAYGSITLGTNDPANPTVTRYFKVFGVSISPEITITQSISAFGSKNVGSSTASTVTFSNTGSGTLAGYVDIPTSQQFISSRSDGQSFSLSAGASASFTVSFIPTNDLSYSYRLFIFSNDSGSPADTVSFTGTGVRVDSLKLIPTSHDFGQVPYGGTGFSGQMYAYNSGRSSVEVGRRLVNGGDFASNAGADSTTVVGDVVVDGGFDKEEDVSAWTLTNCNFTQDVGLYTASNYNKVLIGDGSISQSIDLKSRTYLMIADFSLHNGSGDSLIVTVGGTRNGFKATSYTNGVNAFQITSDLLDSEFKIELNGGSGSTLIDNVKLVEYLTTSLTYTPSSAGLTSTDSLLYLTDLSAPQDSVYLPLTGNSVIEGGVIYQGSIEMIKGIRRK